MPFSDSFIQDYVGFNDDLRPTFNEPIGGCGGSTDCVDLLNTYNPLKTAANRELYAVAYIGNIPHNTPFRQIGRSNEIPGFDRVILSYTEGFTAWDQNNLFSALNITIDPLTLDNTTGSSVIVEGTELIQSTQFATPLTSITLTRDNSEEGFPRYTFVEDIYFGLDARFYTTAGSDINYLQKGILNDNSEVFLDQELPETSTNGSTISGIIGNQYSVARYNFPTSIPLSPDETFVINLGSIQLIFDSQIITC